MIQELQRKIENREARLGVVGLGYVGLPAACLFAEAGFQVTGIDIKAERVESINAGRSPIEGNEPGLAELLSKVVGSGDLHAGIDYAKLAEIDIILLVVDTPIDTHDHTPRYAAMKSACESLGQVLTPGTLVIVESTVSPGTVENVVRPILERASGLKLNVDFYLGACPERVMPGKLLANLRNLSRVCGGSTPETARAMVSLYRHVVQADLDETDITTAELVKTAENAYRDVQIAFANEVALICEANGADVWRVRELLNKSPGRDMLLPGAGVGGHCIPKDSWLLAASVDETVPLQLIPHARMVNDHMPLHMADLTARALQTAGRSPSEAKIAILGYAYLEESDDTRNSPSEVLIQRLQDLGIEYTVHDPWVDEYKGDLAERVRDCDVLVIMVRHQQYRDMDWAALHNALRTPILVDGRNVIAPQDAMAAGYIYYGVGRGNVNLEAVYKGA